MKLFDSGIYRSNNLAVAGRNYDPQIQKKLKKGGVIKKIPLVDRGGV